MKKPGHSRYEISADIIVGDQPVGFKPVIRSSKDLVTALHHHRIQKSWACPRFYSPSLLQMTALYGKGQKTIYLRMSAIGTTGWALMDAWRKVGLNRKSNAFGWHSKSKQMGNWFSWGLNLLENMIGITLGWPEWSIPSTWKNENCLQVADGVVTNVGFHHLREASFK